MSHTRGLSVSGLNSICLDKLPGMARTLTDHGLIKFFMSVVFIPLIEHHAESQIKEKECTSPGPTSVSKSCPVSGSECGPRWEEEGPEEEDASQEDPPPTDAQKRIQDLEEMLQKMVQERGEEKRALEEKERQAVRPKTYYKWVKVAAEKGEDGAVSSDDEEAYINPLPP